MMEKLKIYFVEVVLKRYGPSFVKGALAWLCMYVAAHHGLMETVGLSYDPSDNTMTLELTKFSAWLLAGGTGLIMAFLTAAQHHTTAVVTGTPQSGDKRVAEPLPMPGGERAGDPPKGA